MPAGRPWDYLNPQYAGMRSAAAGGRKTPQRYVAPARQPKQEAPATPSSESQMAGQIMGAVAPFANFIPVAGPGIAAGLGAASTAIPAIDLAAQPGSERDIGHAVSGAIGGAGGGGGGGGRTDGPVSLWGNINGRAGGSGGGGSGHNGSGTGTGGSGNTPSTTPAQGNVGGAGHSSGKGGGGGGS